MDSSEHRNYLHDLSLRLVRLSGNERIRKRIRGAGGGDAFNVLDEVPQFTLDHLLAGKTLGLIPYPNIEDVLKDEKTKEFEDAFHDLREREGREFDSLDEEEERELKDRVREVLGLPPIEEILPDHSIDLPRTPTGEEQPERKHVDRHLQTDIPEDSFGSTLSRIEKRRLVFEREKGLMTFYLAIGFLEWTRQKPNSKDFYHFNSPLLLLPLHFDLSSTSGKIAQMGGDIRLNEDLFHALKEVTGEKVPELPESEEEEEEGDELDIDAYLDLFQTFVTENGRPEWKLRRRMVIGIFKSTGIPPSELLPERFTDESIERMGSWVLGEDAVQERLTLRDVDSEKNSDLAPAFALPVDSSQHSAVLDVAEGMNLVIEGPPGTGKSQTIVNLIAGAINQNKKVLFLAQKTAALEVVRHRLHKVGLGDKCLAIHSEHSSKAEVFEEVGKRIAIEAADKPIRKEFDRLSKRRDKCIAKLNRYSTLLGVKLGTTDGASEDDDLFTAYEAVNEHSMLSHVPNHLKENFSIPAQVGKSLLVELRKGCEPIETLARKLGLEIPVKLNFLRRSRPFSPFELDEFDTIIHNGHALLEPFGAENSDANTESLATELEKKNALLEKRVRLDEIEDQLEKEYKNHDHLSSNELTDLISTLWRANFLTAFLWPSFRQAKNQARALVRNPDVSFPQLRKMAENLKGILKEGEGMKEQLKQGGEEHSTTEGLTAETKQLIDLSERLNKAAEILKVENCLLEEPISANDLKTKLDLLLEHKSSLPDLTAFNQALTEIDGTFHCNEFIRSALSLEHPLADVFTKRFLRELCRELCKEEPDFLEFRGDEIERLRKELSEMETEMRSVYCRMLAATAPDPKTVHSVNARRVGEKRGLALLRHVGAKNKARVTVRELLHRAGTALNEYCPCFLMTPSSVADFLPPDHSFDLLIIDEASQMLVEESAGSLLRSKQIVVVGDRQQMPPTRYMVSTLDVPEDEDQDESILERASLALPYKRRLLYHYRSEDENLIAFSNHEVYDDELLTIPNLREDPTLGVHLIRAGGIYESGKDGSSRDPNPVEAERVVDLILEHMEKFPDRSLGVAVLNLRQATRVEELFEEKASGNSVVTEFLNRWQETPEYFFIKNLENVQGDERDVILIATVFGKNSQGKVYQRFGPISQPQGENRINVLITRAKKRVLVCTSLEPTDLTLEKEGPQVLGRYLAYASAGKLPSAVRKDSEEIASAEEKWFCERLRSDGYEVDPQVGISGWRVNLGIKSPGKPDEYLCGIELDGASYHLAPGARDRDVGRPLILESKGWNIFRVWSIDFFHDPEAEYSRIVRLIENAKRKESESIHTNPQT
ncbi:MAG: DUF4011 domain-containing protein [Opitutae bacterium]|nr:DUF4011 domain-containing protein [Opitutae bacterium]